MNPSNAAKCHKVIRVLHSDLQRAFSKCHSERLDPIVKPVDSLMQLPLPADMRKQLLSSNGNSQSMQSMEYFPKEIQHHILNEQCTAITYNFAVGVRTVVLHFVVFNKRKPDLNMRKLQEHATRVCALMHLVSMHANRATCSSALNIFIYMTKFKKRFPLEKGEALDTEHANTGMSYHCASTNDIVVYRKEEWFKVLIHESFHAFGLSFIESDMPDGVDAAMQRLLQRTYAISHPVRVYETYCEIWARILNVMFACFSPANSSGSSGSSGSSSSDPILNMKLNAFAECVLRGLHRDAQHALQQSAKIMHHMGIPHAVMMDPTKENRAIVAEKYRENTNVFAYYVMTCALQHSPDVFLVWCHKNNHKASMLQFRTILSNFNGFMELLYHCKHECPAPDMSAMSPDDIPGSSMRMTAAPGMNDDATDATDATDPMIQ
jgi:hypothetical protein